jgi:hypothetical protein
MLHPCRNWLSRGQTVIWRMFPKLGDTRVPSGRLNCKEPNLLAMPNRTERGRQICEGFITDDDWVYVSIDESQIEPRVVAHRSGDPALRNVYFNEEDIYSDFAIAAFTLEDKRYQDVDGWHYPGVDKKFHRFPSKTCILAAIYDVTNVGLLEQMPVVCKNCGKDGTLHDCAVFQPLWNENNCQDILNALLHEVSGHSPMRQQDHDEPGAMGSSGMSGAAYCTLLLCVVCLSGWLARLCERLGIFPSSQPPRAPSSS